MAEFIDYLNQAGNNPYKLAPLLDLAFDHRNYFSEEYNQELTDLRKAFDSGNIDAQWFTTVHQRLREFDGLLHGSTVRGMKIPDRFIPAHLLTWEQHLLNFAKDYEGKGKPVTTTLRDDLAKAHTCEEMEVILRSVKELGLDDPLIRKEQKTLDSYIGQNSQPMARTDDWGTLYTKEDQHSAHLMKGDGGSTIREGLIRICDALDSDPGEHFFFEERYKQAKQNYASSQINPTAFDTKMQSARIVSGQIEEQQKAVESIRDVYDKMLAEKGPHINSAEYKRMKEAVKAVYEAQYDPNDIVSVNAMKDKLAEVHAASAKYVEEKAVGKTKKTSRGVERKNEALLLMGLTDPKSLDAMEGLVSDRRLHKNDSPDKTPKTLKELVSEESKANESSFRADRTKKRAAAKAAEKAAKATKAEKPSNDPRISRLG